MQFLDYPIILILLIWTFVGFLSDMQLLIVVAYFHPKLYEGEIDKII